MRLPATCRLADLPALSALSAFIRAARASFLLCLPFALRHAPFILARRMFVFSFCFAYCPKHLRQYHFLFALSSPIAKIFFFFCLFFLPAGTVPSTVSRCRARLFTAAHASPLLLTASTKYTSPACHKHRPVHDPTALSRLSNISHFIMIFNDFAKIIPTFHMTAAVILLDELCFSCRNATFDSTHVAHACATPRKVLLA